MSFAIGRQVVQSLRAWFKYGSSSFKECSTQASNILVGDISGIKTIGINRPNKRNCLDSQTLIELKKALRDFDQDDNFSIAVLYGEGGTFCSGFDLNEITETGYDALLNASTDIGNGSLTVKPLIAAISGFAVAEGFELALACDLRVVEHTAMMGVLGRRFGVPMLLGGGKRLASLIGLSKALDLALTGKLITANDADEIGLVARMVSTGTSLGQAISLATSINKFPLNSLLYDKLKILNSVSDNNTQDYYRKNIDRLLTESLEDSKKHAIKFKEGIGKHGKFHSLVKRDITSWEAEMELEIDGSKFIRKT